MSDEASKMAVHTEGRGPDLVLFHGGMGWWKHWARNIGPLAERFTVHALDHPSYGASAAVPRETTGADYLDLVHRLFLDLFPGSAPLRLAGFSFGGAIAARLARRLGDRVTHLCLVSPAGFPTRTFGERPTRSYREAGDDDARFREIARHNLLVNMLASPESATDEAVDIHAYGVRNARFNSRKVSGGGTLLGDLAEVTCRVRVLWGEKDDSAFRPADLLIGEIRAVLAGPRPPPHPGRRPLVGLRERARGQPAHDRVLLGVAPDRVPMTRPAAQQGVGVPWTACPPGTLPLATAHDPRRARRAGHRGAGRRVRHRRRLRRSPVVRDGDPRARARAAGFRVAILAQPDWQSAEPWRALGRPRLFFGVSAGNMDSMINHYTANRKVAQRRRLLARRPHRAPARPADARLLPALPRGVPRRARHRRRRRSLAPPPRALRLLDRHGAAVDPRVEQGRPARLRHGRASRSSRSPSASRPARPSSDLRDIRGVAYLLGASETPPADAVELAELRGLSAARTLDGRSGAFADGHARDPPTRPIPYNARRLVQRHGDRVVVVNPPAAAPRRAGDGPRSTTCRISARRTRPTRSRSPPSR